MKPLKPSIPPKAKQPEGASVQKFENRSMVGICVLLALAVFAVFGQTFRYEFVNLDDDKYVYENPVVLDGLTFHGVGHVFTHWVNQFYHPLTELSLMLDKQIYGLNAGGYHLTNTLLHAATTILLFLVLRRMIGTRTDKRAGAAASQSGALWPCAFVAAVFAIHPLRAESVAWVTERKDVLSGLFFVLTLGAYVRYARAPFSPGRYLAVIFLFALGLMSKPSLVTLPFLLLLLDYWPLARMQPAAPRSAFAVLRPLIIEKVPLFALSAALSVATVIAERQFLAPAGGVPLFTRIGYAAVSYVVYLGQMVYPAGLAVLYPFPQKGLPLPEIILALALLAGISAGALMLRRRQPYLVVGWLWYLGMLAPMIGLIHVGTVARADRFTYLAQIGVCIMLAWAARDLTISWRNGRRMLGAGAFGVIAVLMVCAWKQTSYWRNSESLWTHALACTSDNSVAHNNLGSALLLKGNKAGAITHFQQALQINPANAEAHFNFGNALLEMGNEDEAITHFQQALQIKPDNTETHNNLGKALLQKGNVDEAITHFQQALQINSDNPFAQNNLGNALLQKGNVDEAITHFQIALQINPDYAEANYNFGNAILQMGKVDEAITHYQQALQINPNYAKAHNNLGNALLQKGNVDEAIAHDQMALQINPNYAEAHNNLGNALLQKGDVAEAIAHYQKALQINPSNAGVLNNLAWVLATCPQASLRNGNQAADLAQRANQLTGGGNPTILRTLAAACAEAGRFPEAVEAAQRALQLAESQSNTAMAEFIRNQLKLYEANSPYHQ